MKKEDSPFFLVMILQAKIGYVVWFYSGILDKNNHGKFFSEVANILHRSNCSRSKIDNLSARKTAITNMLKENNHPIYVSQLSGHENI